MGLLRFRCHTNKTKTHICSSAKNPGVGGYNLLLLSSLAATYQAFLALAFPWAQETSATYTSSELPSGACSLDMQAALPPPEARAQGTFCTRIASGGSLLSPTSAGSGRLMSGFSSAWFSAGYLSPWTDRSLPT